MLGLNKQWVTTFCFTNNVGKNLLFNSINSVIFITLLISAIMTPCDWDPYGGICTHQVS